MTLRDFMTPAQIREALLIWVTDKINFHSRVLDEIVHPNMAEFNRKLNQDNVPAFIAYVIEHVFTEAGQ